MNPATLLFLEKQKASAHNPLGSHQARSRGLAIALAKSDPATASTVAHEISSNPTLASDVSGFHPDSCIRLAHWLTNWRSAL